MVGTIWTCSSEQSSRLMLFSFSLLLYFSCKYHYFLFSLLLPGPDVSPFPAFGNGSTMPQKTYTHPEGPIWSLTCQLLAIHNQIFPIFFTNYVAVSGQLASLHVLKTGPVYYCYCLLCFAHDHERHLTAEFKRVVDDVSLQLPEAASYTVVLRTL